LVGACFYAPTAQDDRSLTEGAHVWQHALGGMTDAGARSID